MAERSIDGEHGGGGGAFSLSGRSSLVFVFNSKSRFQSALLKLILGGACGGCHDGYRDWLWARKHSRGSVLAKRPHGGELQLVVDSEPTQRCGTTLVPSHGVDPCAQATWIVKWRGSPHMESVGRA